MGSLVRLDLKAFFADDRKKAVIFVHPAVHKTVKDVQEYIKYLYELDVQDVQLSWDGFHFSERAGVWVLLESCPHMIEVKPSTSLPHSRDQAIKMCDKPTILEPGPVSAASHPATTPKQQRLLTCPPLGGDFKDLNDTKHSTSLKNGSVQLPTLQPTAASHLAPVQLMPEPTPAPPPQATLQQQIQLPTLQPAATANANGCAHQAQFRPQLLQAPNGETLQIVQQPNGTQTLQLVQLVLQRSMAPTGLTTVSTTTSPVNMGNGAGSLADSDVYLLEEDGCQGEDEEFEEVYESLDSKGLSFETIVLDEDQHQKFLKDHQHQALMDDDLTQSEGQELEYFDELNQQQLENNELKSEDDENRFIIEEVQLEEDDLMDEADEPPDGETSGVLKQAFIEPADGEASVDME